MLAVEDLGHLPPITKGILCLSTGMMLLTSLDLITPLNLYLNYRLVMAGEVWRLLTCFLFLGEFGLQFFWNIYMLTYYCSRLEEDTYRGRSVEFLWMMGLVMLQLLLLSWLFPGKFFCSGAMLNVLTYIWGRRNPHAHMHILLFSVPAPYLSWILVLLSLLIGWQISDHLMGICVGHVYYFFEDVYPYMPTSGGVRLLRCPKFLRRKSEEDEE
eukprot:Polyplicarium_translucidae@DN4515_c0_g1_i1.p1